MGLTEKVTAGDNFQKIDQTYEKMQNGVYVADKGYPSQAGITTNAVGTMTSHIGLHQLGFHDWYSVPGLRETTMQAGQEIPEIFFIMAANYFSKTNNK